LIKKPDFGAKNAKKGCFLGKNGVFLRVCVYR